MESYCNLYSSNPMKIEEEKKERSRDGGRGIQCRWHVWGRWTQPSHASRHPSCPRSVCVCVFFLLCQHFYNFESSNRNPTHSHSLSYPLPHLDANNGPPLIPPPPLSLSLSVFSPSILFLHPTTTWPLYHNAHFLCVAKINHVLLFSLLCCVSPCACHAFFSFFFINFEISLRGS